MKRCLHKKMWLNVVIYWSFVLNPDVVQVNVIKSDAFIEHVTYVD